MLDAWNDNMFDQFIPSWVSCLDESMSISVNQYTCPGWIFCPRKPWPLGNEYHTIACGKSGILYAMELREGKDRPPQRPKPKYDDLGKTVGLLLRLTRQLHATSKVVVLDSGFCVLKGIIELRKRGVFAGALIKKRRYWPAGVDGEAVKAHFAEKEVGSVDVWPGTLDNTPFKLACMKEPDYVLMIMMTYGTLQRVGETHERNYEDQSVKKSKTFQYPEVIFNHYQYRDAVDDNNGARMYPIALEKTWKTTRWPCRIFTFLFATTEVNCCKAYQYIYNHGNISQQDFRKKLGHALINNTYLDKKPVGCRSSPRTTSSFHKLVTLPSHMTFVGTAMQRTKSPYPQ